MGGSKFLGEGYVLFMSMCLYEEAPTSFITKDADNHDESSTCSNKSG